jgi:hypothetical protein
MAGFYGVELTKVNLQLIKHSILSYLLSGMVLNNAMSDNCGGHLKIKEKMK